MKNYGTREMVLAALGIALVYITTMFIKLPNSIGGYLNLGDGFILLFAGFLHPFTAFLVGGSGSALMRDPALCAELVAAVCRCGRNRFPRPAPATRA